MLSIYEDMKKWVLTLLVNLSLVANQMQYKAKSMRFHSPRNSLDIVPKEVIGDILICLNKNVLSQG